jgi:hypothetical protein
MFDINAKGSFTEFVLQDVPDNTKDNVKKILDQLNFSINDIKNEKLTNDDIYELSDDKIIRFWLKSAVRRITEGNTIDICRLMNSKNNETVSDTLDLSGIVYSSSNRLFINNIHIRELALNIRHDIIQGKVNFKLNSAYLCDEDLVYVLIIIDLMIKINSLEKCKNIILCDNIIKGYDSQVVQQLLDKCEILDMRSNPCYHDNKNFFNQINNYKNKLIWIPKDFVSATYWEKYFPDENDRKIIYDTHIQFFNSQ